jgi:DNA mismatch endonuclease, patch repair protein
MGDTLNAEQRRYCMSRVRGKDTSTELRVRSVLHHLGFRFSLHRRDLPGCPDIVLPKYSAAIFVHGCFWHGHKNCFRAARPTSNAAFWNKKLDRNKIRDRKSVLALRSMGWKVLVVWECQVLAANLAARLEGFLTPEGRG